MSDETEATELATNDELATPDITTMQKGAGAIFLAVAAGCLSQGVTGTDLAVYLGCASFVTSALIIGDAVIRNGRAVGAGAINLYRG